MELLKLNLFLIMCCRIFMLQTGTEAMRIKRSHSQATENVTDSGNITKMHPIAYDTKSATATTIPGKSVTLKPEAATTIAMKVAKISSVSTSVMPDVATKNMTEYYGTVSKTFAGISTAAMEHEKNLEAIKLSSPVHSAVVKKPFLEGHRHVPLNHDQRKRRHMSTIYDMSPFFGKHVAMTKHTARPRRQSAKHAPEPPFVYFNKYVSPDGKQELKEMQMLGPEVLIESVQHDLNYGPELLARELGEDLLTHVKTAMLSQELPQRHHHEAKHHGKHATVLGSAMHLLQNVFLGPDKKPAPIELLNERDGFNYLPIFNYEGIHGRKNAQLYDFIDHAMDMALNKNYDALQFILQEKLKEHAARLHETEMKGKAMAQVKKELYNMLDQFDDVAKEVDKELEAEASNHTKPKLSEEDALLVSCPIHHEHQMDKNGVMVDNDVVEVEECHII